MKIRYNKKSRGIFVTCTQGYTVKCSSMSRQFQINEKLRKINIHMHIYMFYMNKHTQTPGRKICVEYIQFIIYIYNIKTYKRFFAVQKQYLSIKSNSHGGGTWCRHKVGDHSLCGSKTTKGFSRETEHNQEGIK